MAGWAPFAVVVVLASLVVLGGSAEGSCPGCSSTGRIPVPADAGVTALTMACPGYTAMPTDDPLCFVVKRMLGYDGLTARIDQGVQFHVGHPFACAVTSSATPGAESIRVGFDADGDTVADTTHGGRIQRRDAQAVVDRAYAVAAGSADPATLADLPSWYLDAFEVGPMTPYVSGIVSGATMIVWNDMGIDMTVDCVY